MLIDFIKWTCMLMIMGLCVFSFAVVNVALLIPFLNPASRFAQQRYKFFACAVVLLEAGVIVWGANL